MDRIRLGLRPGPAPRLLHAGRARAWFRTPAGVAWLDGERLWAALGDEVHVVPLRGDAVIWGRAGRLVADNGVESVVVTTAVAAEVGTRRRHGLDVVIERAPAAPWQAAMRLPDGAASSRELRPYAEGIGVVWRDGGWWYRCDEHGVQAFATARPGERCAVGPCGAVVLGDADAWRRAAAPRGSARPLPVPLDARGWGVRFAADGGSVAGVRDGAAVTVDLRREGGVGRVADRWPVDADGLLLGPDGALDVGEPAFTGLIEASCAFSPPWLAGPGGVVWDLRRGAPVFATPALALGATARVGDRWATVRWDDGDGVWLDASGRRVGRFSVPLPDDDVVSGACADGDALIVATAGGAAFRVRGEAVSAAEADVPSPPRRGEGWRLVRGGIEVGGARWPLPVDGAARFGDAVWAWSSDGLLVALPGQAPPRTR